jgi:predicted metal-dependent hydrolase
MRKRIQLHKKKVEYTLKVSKRAKRMRLAVYCDGAFVVTVPQAMNQNLVEKFIIQKSQWILDKMDYFKSIPGFMFKSNKNDFLKYKDDALALAEERIRHFNKSHKYDFNKINVKNQKTRWGSCSRKGNLNFNYKIALLPSHLADYIIVHELCHLGEFNHSRKFWALVKNILPDYESIRADLRKHSMYLQ